MTRTFDNLTAVIDQLGDIKAKIADLQILEKTLKGYLDDLAPGAYEGETFRLSISESNRETLDMEAVREHLSRQFIAAHTNVTPVRTLRVTARNGLKVTA